MENRYKITILLIGLSLILSAIWFDFVFINSNGSSFEEELMRAGRESDVVIIFNSGGWGTVPFDKAFDFNPIINNTKEIAERMDYRVSVVPYYRTKEDFFAKMGSLKEVLFNFPRGSELLSEKVNKFLIENPDDKIIIAGLSNGANFVNAVMAELKDEKDRVMAIEVGAPFGGMTKGRENVLSFGNEKDILANGELFSITWSVFTSPFVWAGSNLFGHPISLSQAMHISGHEYRWQDMKAELAPFIERGLSGE